MSGKQLYAAFCEENDTLPTSESLPQWRLLDYVEKETWKGLARRINDRVYRARGQKRNEK